MPQPTLEPLRRWDPERIGSYVLLGRLGAGAMGRVYLGRSTAGRLVAVKTIKIELADEAGYRARFAHEVAAAVCARPSVPGGLTARGRRQPRTTNASSARRGAGSTGGA